MKGIVLSQASRVAVCLALLVACDGAGSGSGGGSATPPPVASTAPSSAPSTAAGSSPSGSPEARESPSAATPDAGGSANPAAATEPTAYHGRGVFYAEAAIGCPHLALGTRGENACLRIGLDDEHSSAEIDRVHHKIVLHNDGTYKSEQIVADVVLPGWTESSKGRAPISVHCVLRKKGTTFSTKIYAHPVHREKHTKVELESLEVVLNDGKTDTVLLSTAAAQTAAADPGPMAKLAGFFTEVTDTLAAGAKSANGPRPVGDITIAIGVGPAADKALHAQLFRTGADAELRLTALSSLIPSSMAWKAPATSARSRSEASSPARRCP